MTQPGPLDDLGAVIWSAPTFEDGERVILRFEDDSYQLLQGTPGRLVPQSPRLKLPMAIARAREISAGRQPEDIKLALTALAVALVAMAAPYGEGPARLMSIKGAPADGPF
jgi:hypothetical protein